ncbi:related to heterokaryon incompatibility protein (het-6OR allele) [Fusarium proliferatum]|nr:related to heterokaryon incompatibility protein (het-6OR allele) [Fusarium proliferatum]
MQADTNNEAALDIVPRKIPLFCAPTYRPLDLAKRQIRILHILPGQRGEPVPCTLHTASLDDSPSYEALSYSWGDPHICHIIEVDGQQATVTENLYNALRRLRFVDRTRHIWADALCINQADTTERTHQVRLMRNIYSSTIEGILWLGEFSSTSDTGANSVSQQTVATAFKLIRSLAEDHHWNSQEHAQSMAREEADALTALLNLSWWQRAWTVKKRFSRRKQLCTAEQCNYGYRKSSVRISCP